MNTKPLLKSLLICSFSLTVLAGCSNSEKYDCLSDIEMIPVKVAGDSNYSLYKPDGTILYRNQLPAMPSAVFEGVFSMETPDGYSLFSAQPDSMHTLCSGLVKAGFANDGVIPIVRKDGRIEIIDRQGKPVSTIMPYEGKEIVSAYSSFSDKLLPVMTEDYKYGYVDTSGNMVIKPIYTYGYPFSNGKAIVTTRSDDSLPVTALIIDTEGKELYRYPDNFFVCDSHFDYGYIYLQSKDDYRIYKLNTSDFTLTEMLPEIRKISSRSNEYTVFTSDTVTHNGVIDNKGAEIIAPNYSEIDITYLNQFIVSPDGTHDWKIIDNKNTVLSEFPQARAMESFGRFGIGILDEEYISMLDAKNFQPINDIKLSRIGVCKNVNFFLQSQYFDWDKFAHDIIGITESDGFAKYKLGYLASTMLDNTNNLGKNPIVPLNELKLVKNKYNAEVYATFIANNVSLFIALLTDGDLEYYLKLLTIDFNTDIPTNMATASALKTALEEAGYSQIDVTKDNASHYAAIYKNNKNDIGVFVDFVPGQKTGTLSLYRINSNNETDNLRSTIAKYNGN